MLCRKHVLRVSIELQNPPFKVWELLTAVVSSANHIIRKILTRIVNGLFQRAADATFTHLENKVWFENSAKCVGNYSILYHKTSKEDSTVLCSVVKHIST